MSDLCLAPIVEGHGEVYAIRRLVERIWYELLGGNWIKVLRPIRQPRDRLTTNKEGTLDRAINLAAGKLQHDFTSESPGLVLLLLDAHDAAPCRLGPQLCEWAREARQDIDVACVLANVEYETWFVAAAESLADYVSCSGTDDVPAAPERNRSGKHWIEDRWRGTKYSETVDQPKLTAKMDLHTCRQRAPSFDKLCRELEKRCSQATE